MADRHGCAPRASVAIVTWLVSRLPHLAQRNFIWRQSVRVSVAAETLVIVGLSVRPGLLPLDA
jgi:hypothetical protein